MIISSAFDGGNIEVLSVEGDAAELNIRTDTNSHFFQWFYFRVTNGGAGPQIFHIRNAGEAAFPRGWEDYRVCVSIDRETWTRHDTTFADGTLSFTLDIGTENYYVAYFAPYTMDRHHSFIAGITSRLGWAYRDLGATLMGQSMDCVSVGDGPLTAWIIARQHPGETMAEHWMEGFVEALAADTSVASEARRLMHFHIVPNMNPDGSKLGNLRTNQAGANLNREWNVATLERSPECVHVKKAMEVDPPALCLDVHGDEALPYNFIAGAEGIPGYTNDQAAQLDDFLMAYKAASPDFQTKHGYSKSAPGKANLSMCTNYTAHAYGGLSMTLEMPFKDNANRPDAVHGWSAERCRDLGAKALEAMVVWAKTRD